jgi:plastocyanin
MLKRMTPVVAFMALMLMLSACGDDSSTTTANPNAQAISASARSFAYDPASWTVSSGEDVTISLTNTSDTEHEWVIMKAPIASEDEFTEDGVYWEIEAQAGETNSGTFTPPEPGTYQIICGLEGHFTAGMVGELVVTP